MELRALAVDAIHRRADARALSEGTVAALIASIGDVGLLNPIRVRALGDGWELLAGGHRLEAHRRLLLAEIDAFVVGDDDLHAELAMIDENLCRAELSPSERARQTARRKAIYEELYPETRRGAVGRGGYENSRQVGDYSESAEPERFTSNTAAVTGQSERSVQRDAERGEKVLDEVLDLIRGTPLDTGSYLDQIKRLPPNDQVVAASRDLAWERQKEQRRLEAEKAKALPTGARAIMADRREPDDSLDYFPTPPWATRALVEDVLAPAGQTLAGKRVWDPACGEGHMTGVLAEYSAHVLGTDIFDYSAGGRSAPGWDRAVDFLSVPDDAEADWIITNPPFGELTLPFALKALRIARVGVALFVRLQWLEGVDRFNQLFSAAPPQIYAQFAERVPLCKGRWDPEGSTATAYGWLVWGRTWGLARLTELWWIPPGGRIERSRPDDIDRFTARPVLPPKGPLTILPVPSSDDDEAIDLPAFLPVRGVGESAVPA